MAALTQEHDILLVVRLMPVWKGAVVLSDTAREQLNRLERTYANTVVGWPEIWEFERDLFIDEFHLYNDGAAIATTLLVAQLKRILIDRGLKFGDH